MAPRVRVRLPKAADGFLDAVTSVFSEASRAIRHGERVVNAAKRAKRAGRGAASALREASPRIILDVAAGGVRIDLDKNGTDTGDDDE